MLIPVTFEEPKGEEIPVVSRPVDDDTVERDLSRLRVELWRLAVVDAYAALTFVNSVSRVIGRPL